MKLDTKTVAALKLDGKTDMICFDAKLKGFGYRLRTGADGKLLRTWIAQYKRAGATRRMSQPAEKLTAEQARGWAKKILAKVALGEDPQAAKTERRGKDQLTLRSQVAEFLAVKEDALAKRTMVEMRRYLTDPRYFEPLQGMAVDQVKRKDIAARVVAIMRQCGNPTAVRARAALSGFFTWTMRMGLTEANPVIGTVTPEESGGRDRVLTDVELAAIWRACGDDDHGRVIKLLMLTACRRAEIGDMAWSEFDDPEQPTSFTIPAARTKNGKPHTLPVTPTMRRIIAGVPHRVTRDQLFGARSTGFTIWGRGKAELDERSGVCSWRLHDIRRSTATKLADLGVQPHIIEQILNHQSGHRRGVAGTYNRSLYEREVRAALLMWDDRIRTLVEGGEHKILHMSAPAS